MRAAGLRDAIVFSLRTNAASEALYRSAGFDELAIHRRYTRPCQPRGRSPEPATYNRRHDHANPAATRIERDSMGEMEVPADALYGASTQRAVLNFPISGPAVPAGVHPGPRA